MPSNLYKYAAVLVSIAPAIVGALHAEPAQNFCAKAKGHVEDITFSNAVQAVFPKHHVGTTDVDCIYPYKLLRYGDADVLITLRDAPGEPCHGCGAKLSAYVLDRQPGTPRLVARFVDVETYGTFGNPGDVDAVQIAGHDAIAIVAGGTFQGYSSDSLSYLVFQGGHLDAIEPSLPLSANNGGAITVKTKVIAVEGGWRIGHDATGLVTIDYKILVGGKTTRAKASWRLDGKAFVPQSGAVPEEWKKAGGG